MKFNHIYHGECVEIMKTMPDESVDLVFTDPPYNISGRGKVFHDYRRTTSHDIDMDFGEWDYGFEIEPFLEQAKRLLHPTGSIIVWTSEQLFGKYHAWLQEHMYPKQMFVFVKTNPLPQFRLTGYRQTTELMFWAMKQKMTMTNPNFIFQTQQEMTNVFYAPIVGGHERTEHPTQKPLSITQKIIRTHCRPGGTVLDPFLGSGTTAVACVREGRRYIGVEIDEKYVRIALNRIKQERTLYNA